MPNLIFCKKLKKQALSLSKPPMPTPLGEKIYREISKPAWESWQQQQIILINEYRLNLMDKPARDFLMQEMKKFLFTDEPYSPPAGYQPIK